MLTGNALPPDQAAVGDGWRDMWLAHRAHAAVPRGVARAPAPRRLLAPGLGLRALRGDRGARLRGRRLGRRLQQRDPAADRGPAGPAQGSHRPVVARLPAGRRARPGDRLPAGVPALVRPAPQGHRDRDHGRAAAARCGCRIPSRRPRITRSARGAGCPSRHGRRRGAGRGRGTSRPSADRASQHRVDRHRRRRVVRGRGRGRLARRPARRGRALAELHLGAARRGDGDPRLPRGRARCRGRPPERARGGAPVRRRPRRRLPARHARRAQPQPPRRPRPAASRWCRITAATSRSASTPSPSACRPATACASRVDRVLAVGVAHAEPVTLTLHARPAAGADASAARRASCADFGCAGVGGAAGGRDDRARPDGAHARPRPGHRRARAALRVGRRRPPPPRRQRHRDARHPRHDLPHRRRRPALGQRPSAVQLGARPRRVAHARAHRLRR